MHDVHLFLVLWAARAEPVRPHRTAQLRQRNQPQRLRRATRSDAKVRASLKRVICFAGLPGRDAVKLRAEHARPGSQPVYGNSTVRNKPAPAPASSLPSRFMVPSMVPMTCR